jgi:hypothetical protein
MPNGEELPDSAQYPPRLCPKCRGLKTIACDLCDPVTRMCGYFKAAAWLSNHPELHDTPPEFPATREPDDEK